MKKLEPITPGEILLEEFLKPMGLSQYRLAKEIGVPAQRISEIVAGQTFDNGGYRFAVVSILWSIQRLLAARSGCL